MLEAPDLSWHQVSLNAMQYLLNFVLGQVTCHQPCVKQGSLHTALTTSIIAIDLRSL